VPTAKALIDAAHEVGADAVKFQKGIGGLFGIMLVKAGMKFCFNGVDLIPECFVCVVFDRLRNHGFGNGNRFSGSQVPVPQTGDREGTLRIFDSTVNGGRANRGGGALVSGATL